MHGLKFTLTPAGVARVHDAVICLSKFSETVSIEARPDKVNEIWSSSSSLIIFYSTHLLLFLQLSLTALNSSKSAYACFCLDGADFFDEYLYSSNFSERKRPDGVVEARFTCQVYNKVYF
jgi:cell cycle checkpoint control protein RAD9A